MAHTLPGPPLAGLASLGLGPPTQKDWDQMSMYSQRSQNHSVNRARMYHHMDRAGMIIVTIMCRNDELSWLLTNRLSATRS